MALTLIELQERLLDAQSARHALLTGRREASVSYDGKSVSFSQIDLPKLEAYIAELQSQIDALAGTARRRRGPLYVGF